MDEFKDMLEQSCFILDLKATTKDGIIEEMVNAMAAEGKIQRKDEVLSAVMERERKMSTGMSGEIAIPHAKTNSVSGLVTVFAVKRSGIDFKSLDGKPTRLFIMTVSPTANTEHYVKYLGMMGKVLKSKEAK